jgi:hypothetical protein
LVCAGKKLYQANQKNGVLFLFEKSEKGAPFSVPARMTMQATNIYRFDWKKGSSGSLTETACMGKMKSNAMMCIRLSSVFSRWWGYQWVDCMTMRHFWFCIDRRNIGSPAILFRY